MKRIAACLTLIAAPVLLKPAGLTAQEPVMPARLPALSELLGDYATLSLVPSLGWIRPGARSALDARLFWPGRSEHDVTTQLGLEIGGARFDLRSYARSALDLRFVRNGRNISPWLGGALGMGSGAGPSRVYQASAGTAIHWLDLAVRSTWLQRVPTMLDTFPMRAQQFVNQRFADAELTGTHRTDALELAFTTGRRFGSFTEQRVWGFATLVVPVRNRVGISLASGWRPEQRERAQPGGGFAQIAVRFDVTPRRPERALPTTTAEEELGMSVWPLLDGYRLRLTARSARTVELKGDLSDWEVRAFHPVAPGVWELEVTVPAGVYRINIRIDQHAWIVPGGLIAVPDGFGGTAGVLNLH